MKATSTALFGKQEGIVNIFLSTELRVRSINR